MKKTISCKKLDAGELLSEIEAVFAEVTAIARKENKKSGFCIGNTTQKINRDYFFTPIRNTSRCVCGSVIIDCVAVAEVIARTLDGRVDYFFVDTEKKISPELYGAADAGNVEKAVRSIARKSKILTYKGNDLTVDAVDAFLAQLMCSDFRGLGGKKAAIIGVGNIGFKLALKLTERGSHVVLIRRNTKALQAIVTALNFVKPRGTIAKISGTSDIAEAMKNADIVIGLTPGTHDITAEMLQEVNGRAVLIDGGKGSFAPGAIEYAHEHNIPVYRASVGPSFDGQVEMLLKLEEVLLREMGRKVIDGTPVVSGSLLGHDGDIVVDNIFKPVRIYGVANGCGDFKRELSSEEKARIERLRGKIFLGEA